MNLFYVAGRRIAYALVRSAAPGAYAQDGLISVHSNAFMQDPAFIKAYARGVKAFVECGVNKGFLSSAVMEYLDWNSLDRDFFLLDTFAGLDERFVSDGERKVGALRRNAENLQSGFYIKGADSVRANFAQWPRARIVEGAIPETLGQVTARQVA